MINLGKKLVNLQADPINSTLSPSPNLPPFVSPYSVGQIDWKLSGRGSEEEAKVPEGYWLGGSVQYWWPRFTAGLQIGDCTTDTEGHRPVLSLTQHQI